ncbi:MAG: hypothetical protein P8O96_08965 [Flavobacteriaceae bacterium]|jgi:hypothetical protein|nr:hypothetical protein [Flavobacteriaceae bacterium]MDG1793283.1 hypothetical protein [Flavobacteriaceae bacterium]
MTIFILILAVILMTVGIVYLIDKYVPKKYKPFILVGLWTLIIYLGYITFMSIYGEIQFNQLKEKRYKVVIENLKDIRDSELAHRTVTGQFEGNWDSLVKFIETEKFTITQRRDSTVIDKELTRIYGVDTTKDIVIIDTLGFVPVKDSLFGADPRYKTMMYIPTLNDGQKFDLKAGVLEQNGVNIPVFEASVSKKILLFDQDENLVDLESEVKSVEGVNGPTLKVGSMDEVNTNGNWPKNYSKDQ